MDTRMFARLTAVVFVAAAVAAALIAARSADKQSEPFALRDRAIAPRDPLAAELLRCSVIGETGPRDPGCLSAWAESRRRFLRQRKGAITPAPAQPETLFSNLPASADPDRKEGEGAGVPPMQAAPSGPKVP
ncbi:putative entry exclusion protein TrbK-alt [Mesorhizobium sp. WSM4935]|uniref:putative entry exclusion protein TrbK-alt n=1 Tax=Mesorhizobium sp. WSM4935 TaxID=3038547 RepID=UPI0024155FD8|nr:putative entry exclusion protein TrbK-alt [Mesorhizobium sp. WSM4935]MDG4875241.1 putative entry exclusion protein TrbK-alt [Mesorhizobium sp. WSM4935]